LKDELAQGGRGAASGEAKMELAANQQMLKEMNKSWE